MGELIVSCERCFIQYNTVYAYYHHEQYCLGNQRIRTCLVEINDLCRTLAIIQDGPRTTLNELCRFTQARIDRAICLITEPGSRRGTILRYSDDLSKYAVVCIIPRCAVDDDYIYSQLLMSQEMLFYRLEDEEFTVLMQRLGMFSVCNKTDDEKIKYCKFIKDVYTTGGELIKHALNPISSIQRGDL